MTDTITTTEPGTDTSEKQPAVEAIATAMAMQAHQHEAAQGKEEDAPRELVQAQLPIPRPPFDYRAAVLRIAEKETDVEALARGAERAKKAYSIAKNEYEEAAEEMQALIRQLVAEMKAREMTPAERQQELPHSSTCAFERENPGQVCMICHQEREAARQVAVAAAEDQALYEIAEAVAEASPVGVVVCWTAGNTTGYLTIENGTDVDWTEDVSQAEVFESEEDARTNLAALGIERNDLTFLPDPMAADPAVAAEPPTEPMPEPPDESDLEPDLTVEEQMAKAAADRMFEELDQPDEPTEE